MTKFEISVAGAQIPFLYLLSIMIFFYLVVHVPGTCDEVKLCGVKLSMKSVISMVKVIHSFAQR